jgi:hypothetical protein
MTKERTIQGLTSQYGFVVFVPEFEHVVGMCVMGEVVALVDPHVLLFGHILTAVRQLYVTTAKTESLENHFAAPAPGPCARWVLGGQFQAPRQ